MRGRWNDTDFTRCYVLEQAQVNYSSHEHITFVKMTAEPPHQDANAGCDCACPHQRSNYCNEDGSTRPIFSVGVVMGQRERRHDCVDSGFLCRRGCLYARINGFRII